MWCPDNHNREADKMRKRKLAAKNLKDDPETKADIDFCEMGQKCSTYDACNHLERRFCRTILSKIIPVGQFSPQLLVYLKGIGFRKIDFAFQTPDGVNVAIELDGYCPHVRDLTVLGHDRQLKRQNDLLLNGWKVLRFSRMHVHNGVVYVMRTIRTMIGMKDDEEIICNEIKKPEQFEFSEFYEINFSVAFADIKQKRSTIHDLSKNGFLWSALKKKWYFPRIFKLPKLPEYTEAFIPSKP
jgi:very-short-patch-repair endonuclease